jgi:hypothetical protein
VPTAANFARHELILIAGAPLSLLQPMVGLALLPAVASFRVVKSQQSQRISDAHPKS